MKYIITESKLNEVIDDYLYELFPIDNVHYTSPLEYDDETGEEWEDDNRYEFYLGDYGDEDTIFKWYDCGYFDPGSRPKSTCPVVIVEHPYDDTLFAYFGDKWEEPFKRWFYENFNLPVKTVEWSRMR